MIGRDIGAHVLPVDNYSWLRGKRVTELGAEAQFISMMGVERSRDMVGNRGLTNIRMVSQMMVSQMTLGIAWICYKKP